MARPALIALIAVLALPGTAQAARVKIGPRAPAVSQSGVATIRVTNPNRHVLRGSTTARVGERTVARRTVRLRKRSVTSVELRFGQAAMEAVRAAGGRATITIRLRRPGGGRTTARRTLTFRLSSGAPPQTPAPPVTAPPVVSPPAPAGPTRWAGRLGTEGAYDDLELTVTGAQMEITKRPTITVVCYEVGGSYGTALSFEIFDAPGPWTIGTDGEVVKQALAVNSFVSRSPRSITYAVTGTAQQAGRITGQLRMSFTGLHFDFFDATYTPVDCSGGSSFEAVPVG
jgi:hypothetical protein